MMRNGIPRFANLRAYTGGDTSIAAVAQFARREAKGAFSWEEIARYRERWKRPPVLKGILHPDDAEKAVALGVDGLVVSNHGGRQIEALPAAIDALPAIDARVGSRPASRRTDAAPNISPSSSPTRWCAGKARSSRAGCRWTDARHPAARA
jgi:FMN-dependent dehydrogenase